MFLWNDDEPDRRMTPDGMKVFADFDEAKLPKDVPTGVYKAKLRRWKVVLNVPKGKQPYVQFSLRIAEGEFVNVPLVGKAYLSDACRYGTRMMCGHLGIKISDWPGTLPSLPCMIQVENHGHYAEVKSMKPLPLEPTTEPSAASPEVNLSSGCDTELNEDADGFPGAL